jgi:hypothetical protein
LALRIANTSCSVRGPDPSGNAAAIAAAAHLLDHKALLQQPRHDYVQPPLLQPRDAALPTHHQPRHDGSNGSMISTAGQRHERLRAKPKASCCATCAITCCWRWQQLLA